MALPDDPRPLRGRVVTANDTFDPGVQCAGGCGYAPEHCRCPLPGQPTLDLGSSDLFGGAFADPPAPEPQPDDSYGVRLTKRQKADVTLGIHPLTGTALRDDAETCGTCRFRDPDGHRHAKSYPKCMHPNSPRTGGPKTDVRAWWPACTRWEALS